MSEVRLRLTAGRVRCECGRYVVLMSQPETWETHQGRRIVTAWGQPQGSCACGCEFVGAPEEPPTDTSHFGASAFDDEEVTGVVG